MRHEPRLPGHLPITRLLLLDALRQKDLRLRDDGTRSGGSVNRVKHLATLKDAGLIAVEKGSMSMYSLQCQCLDSFWMYESVLEQNLKAYRELVRL
jgi:hypothetical protein